MLLASCNPEVEIGRPMREKQRRDGNWEQVGRERSESASSVALGRSMALALALPLIGIPFLSKIRREANAPKQP